MVAKSSTSSVETTALTYVSFSKMLDSCALRCSHSHTTLSASWSKTWTSKIVGDGEEEGVALGLVTNSDSSPAAIVALAQISSSHINSSELRSSRALITCSTTGSSKRTSKRDSKDVHVEEDCTGNARDLQLVFC